MSASSVARPGGPPPLRQVDHRRWGCCWYVGGVRCSVAGDAGHLFVARFAVRGPVGLLPEQSVMGRMSNLLVVLCFPDPGISKKRPRQSCRGTELSSGHAMATRGAVVGVAMAIWASPHVKERWLFLVLQC